MGALHEPRQRLSIPYLNLRITLRLDLNSGTQTYAEAGPADEDDKRLVARTGIGQYPCAMDESAGQSLRISLSSAQMNCPVVCVWPVKSRPLGLFRMVPNDAVQLQESTERSPLATVGCNRVRLLVSIQEHCIDVDIIPGLKERRQTAACVAKGHHLTTFVLAGPFDRHD